ncbi:MAG: hypothetical protein Q9210_005061 [Variospora velana]
MYLALWIAAISFLRFLPLCTALPVAQASAHPDACTTPSPENMEASCWTSLNMGNFFSNWTENNILSNPPRIGTIYCRPHEIWAQCFLRFAYGYQRQSNAPMDCSTFKSTSCHGPAKSLTAKPTSAEYWYGAQAISGLYLPPQNTTYTSSCRKTNRPSAVHTYIENLSSALLFTTAKPGTLQSAYNNASINATFPNNPVDATLIQLLTANTKTKQDTAFAAYMKASPSAGNFTRVENAPPDDAVVYKNLVAMLEKRVQDLMSGWGVFAQVTVEGGEAWMTEGQDASDFVRRWTTESVGQQLERLDELTEGSLGTLMEDPAAASA